MWAITLSFYHSVGQIYILSALQLVWKILLRINLKKVQFDGSAQLTKRQQNAFLQICESDNRRKTFF